MVRLLVSKTRIWGSNPHWPASSFVLEMYCDENAYDSSAITLRAEF